MNNPADLPVQPGAIILCIARDTAIVRIGATKEECAADGSEPIVVMQQGPTGKTGEKGEKGDQGDPGLNGADGTNGTNGTNGIDGKDGTNGKDGQPGKDGIDGKPGQPGKDGTNGEDGRDGSPQVWAVVNASGKVVDSSTKVKVRRPTDSAGRYVVKTNAVKLPDCGVAVQSMRLGSDGPRKFLVSTKSRSTGPRLSSGEILVEAFQHGQRRDGGFALVATCDKKK